MSRALAFLILLIYLSPNILFPEKARYLIHDNLNSNTVWLKNLAESGKITAPNHAIVPQALNGLERGCYPSELNVLPWLYSFFSPLAAYNINILLIHLIGFFGMALFLKKHVLEHTQERLAYFCALLFAILPFWPGAGLSIAGQPLLLYAFFNILKNSRQAKNFIIIGLFPFYSSFIFSNVFFVAGLSFIFLFHCIKNKSINYVFLFTLFVFSLLSLGCEYRLILMRYLDHFVSNREELGIGTLNIFGIGQLFFRHLLYGHYHFHSYQSPLLIGFVALSFFLVRDTTKRYVLLQLTIVVCSLSFLFVLFQWKSFMHLVGGVMPLFQMRFQALAPLAWYVLLAYAASSLMLEKPRLKGLVSALLGAMLLYGFFPLGRSDYYSSDFAENSFYRTYFDTHNNEYNTFDGYYQRDLFKKVAHAIPKAGYVGCLGINSEVAQYNGYNTIGGYFPIFPLSYMESVEAIVKDELSKSGKKMHSKRPELYSYELQQKKSPIQNLAWNFDRLRGMHCRYVFSTTPIKVKDLIDEQVFESKTERLYVYRLLD